MTAEAQIVSDELSKSTFVLGDCLIRSPFCPDTCLMCAHLISHRCSPVILISCVKSAANLCAGPLVPTAARLRQTAQMKIWTTSGQKTTKNVAPFFFLDLPLPWQQQRML